MVAPVTQGIHHCVGEGILIGVKRHENLYTNCNYEALR